MMQTSILKTEVTSLPLCPECQTQMGKKGKRWSGRHKKQLWLCFHCGRTLLTNLDGSYNGNGNGNHSGAVSTQVKPVPTVQEAMQRVTDVRVRQCDGLITYKETPELPPKHCHFHSDRGCIRLSWTVTCEKFSREQWQSLPMV